MQSQDVLEREADQLAIVGPILGGYWVWGDVLAKIAAEKRTFWGYEFAHVIIDGRRRNATTRVSQPAVSSGSIAKRSALLWNEPPAG